MIFLHLIVGLILGNLFGYFFFFLIGAVFADLDHVYLYFIKNKFFKWSVFVDVLKHEDKYGIKSKTPLFHSILGMLFFTAIVYPFSSQGALFFGIAYLSHLLLDLPDSDEMQLFYPFKVKFKGPLPIWSKLEQIVTVISVILLVALYIL